MTCHLWTDTQYDNSHKRYGCLKVWLLNVHLQSHRSPVDVAPIEHRRVPGAWMYWTKPMEPLSPTTVPRPVVAGWTRTVRGLPRRPRRRRHDDGQSRFSSDCFQLLGQTICSSSSSIYCRKFYGENNRLPVWIPVWFVDLWGRCVPARAEERIIRCWRSTRIRSEQSREYVNQGVQKGEVVFKIDHVELRILHRVRHGCRSRHLPGRGWNLRTDLWWQVSSRFDFEIILMF